MFEPSANGIAFTGSHEGLVTRAYKDQGGVVTIGRGFTNLSPTCRNWFIEHFGHPLRMGDKMTAAQADDLLLRVLRVECAPVANSLLPATQDAFDAEDDVIYNCGPRAAGWQWAVAAKAQQYVTAASLLLNTAVTASGMPSAGLRNRRAAEAALLSNRAIQTMPTNESVHPDDVARDQKNLKTLKYYAGPEDGNKDSPTYIKAVKSFQRAYGLTVDGIVGTATRSTIARALASRAGSNLTVGTGLGGGGIGSAISHFGLHLDNPWLIVGLAVGALAVAYVGFVLWHNRGVLLGKRTPA